MWRGFLWRRGAQWTSGGLACVEAGQETSGKENLSIIGIPCAGFETRKQIFSFLIVLWSSHELRRCQVHIYRSWKPFIQSDVFVYFSTIFLYFFSFFFQDFDAIMFVKISRVGCLAHSGKLYVYYRPAIKTWIDGIKLYHTVVTQSFEIRYPIKPNQEDGPPTLTSLKYLRRFMIWDFL